jgi:GR25 family glycosyltransferase involved in LPS biosynthesis
MDNLKNILFNYKVKLININNNKNSIINEKIQKIFVINLLEDSLQRNYIITIMNKLNINFTLVIVNKVLDKDYQDLCPKKHISKEELGCCLSHLYCLNYIIKNNIKNSIILEDDVIFHKKFVKEFTKIDLNNCDFLLLGAHDYSFSSLNYLHVQKNNLYHPDTNSNCLFGAHANYYSWVGAKCMFEIRSSLISFFDKEYMLMFQHFENTSFICYPNLIVTDVSKSHLNHSKHLFSMEEIDYYKKCFIQFDFNNYHFIYLDLLLDIKKIKKEEKEIFSSYENYIEYSLQKNPHLSSRPEYITLIKNRFSMDFFNLLDIKNIFS